MEDATSHAELELTFLRPEEGGRSTPVYLNVPGYRPHLRVPPDGEFLGVEFVTGPEGPAPPGEPIAATVRFLYENRVDYSPLVVGTAVEVMEGNRVVARGRVTGRKAAQT